MAKNRSNTSLTLRLNATLFFRQLRTMLMLDMVICVLFSVGLFYCKDKETIAFLEKYTASPHSYGTGRNSMDADTAFSFYDGEILLWDQGCSIYWVKDKPEAVYLPEGVWENFDIFSETVQIGRWLPNRVDPRLSWDDQVWDITYQVSKDYAGGWLVAETPLGLPVVVFGYCFTVILVIEALSLLSSLKRNGRNISKTLRPLQELAETAQALTAKGGRLSPEALKRLTGALDSINVSHLDARVPLSGISNELMPLAEAINEMLARIDDAYRSQIQFVSDASHELRTPIAVIQGYADILTRWGTEDPETMRESIAAIHQEAGAMKELVEQLLFLARGDTDFMREDWTTVNLSTLGEEVYREVAMIDENHRFNAEITPDVMVEGNDGLLKQLIRVLVDNSIKYTPQGGQINLRVDTREGQAAVAVQDEGAGIPEGAIPHIFDRFYRADESRTRDTGGTGLGLAIAKWIAQRHDGSIEVLSREKIGTRMTLLLPLYAKANTLSNVSH